MRNLLKTIYLLVIFSLFNMLIVYAQENANIMKSKTASATFFSEAPLENIEAFNETVRAAIALGTGELVFIVPIKGFDFEKNLMEQHFNDQYMESDKYPEAKFVGSVIDWDGKPSDRTEVHVEGTLTIHGVSKYIKEKAVLEPVEEGMKGSSTFLVRLADYKIKVPRMVIKNIAEVVQVTVSADFEPVN